MANYQVKDRLYHQAKKDQYFSRAAYKLLELQKKYRFIKKGSSVLDLGCSPGAWSQVACQLVGPKGQVTGSDLIALPKENLQKLPKQFEFIAGDINDPKLQDRLAQGSKFTVVLSDMAPKLSGIKDRDQMACLELLESAQGLVLKVLNPGGTFICKFFPGAAFQDIQRNLQPYFQKTKVLNLEATRKTSKEQYLYATGFKSSH